MRTRGTGKRTRARKDDEDILSPTRSPRKKRPTKPRPIWNKSLIFAGPKSLDLFLVDGTLTFAGLDEFAEQAQDVVDLSHATLRCRRPVGAPLLPPQLRRFNGRKTLVLDIDETLVHSVTELDVADTYDATFEVQHNGATKMIGMKKRPFVEQFLEWCGEHFELITFTSAIKPYSDRVLKILDPMGQHVKYRLSREHCTVCNDEVYFKNLDYLRRELSQTIIVDNSPQAFAYHLDNGIPIQGFYGGQTDDELLKLKNFLEGVLEVDDVRCIIKAKFQLRKFLGYLNMRRGYDAQCYAT